MYHVMNAFSGGILSDRYDDIESAWRAADGLNSGYGRAERSDYKVVEVTDVPRPEKKNCVIIWKLKGDYEWITSSGPLMTRTAAENSVRAKIKTRTNVDYMVAEVKVD